MKFNDDNFIGIFDSGIGGISVLNSCISLMPNENYIYYADSLNFPYGKKSKDELAKIGIQILSNFDRINAKEVIIACNSMTTTNIGFFKDSFKKMHIEGTYPDFSSIFTPGTILNEKFFSIDKRDGFKITRNKLKLLIIATSATSNSFYLKEAVKNYSGYIDIYIEPADFIVKAVENDILESFDFKLDLKDLFKEYKDIDYLLLGCTHFPHAIDKIREVLGDNAKIISGGDVTATNAYNYLINTQKLNNNVKPYIRIVEKDINDNKIKLYKKLIKSNSDLEFTQNFI